MNSIRLNGCCGNPQECHWQYAPECQDDGTDKTTISAIIRPVSDRANRPEQRSMVCVFGGRNGMVWAREAQYVGDTFYAHNEEFDNYSFALSDIIYWQPLPTLLGDKMEAAQKNAIPDGYVVVRAEPTKAMIDAGWDAFALPGGEVIAVYKAMIAAKAES